MTYVGIISLIFSIMDIHGYKVPSKSRRGNSMGYDNVFGLCPMIGKANSWETTPKFKVGISKTHPCDI